MRSKLWSIVRRSFILLFLIGALIGIFIGIFFLTALIYDWIGYTPPLFIVQVINSLVGLFLFILMIAGVNSLMPGMRAKQMRILEPIFEAMKRIARGDFKVRLNPTLGGNNILTTELAKSVNEMAEELNQLEHLRQEFISNVSHEIQSPLTSIRGFARALRDEHLSMEKRDHYLSIIELESTRLSRLTDNMLKLASLEAAHVRVELKTYRLDKQIRTLILSCEPQWTSKAIDMNVALEEVEILADEDQLSQVWGNLLHNSIKFTPAGGRICVEVQQLGKQIECRITDTGRGIAEEAQAHVFERFYKEDRARERAQEGSGLGLAIAKKVVELHHGTIGVASQPGAGTTLCVSLPVGL